VGVSATDSGTLPSNPAKRGVLISAPNGGVGRQNSVSFSDCNILQLCVGVNDTACGREVTRENQGKKTPGVHDVHRAETRPKPETCWKSMISFHEPEGEGLHPRPGNRDIGIATWRRRHANADGVRDRHHTCEEPREGELSRTALQQQRGERSPRLL
jgi:hypothetical protein